jgi:hypothetical protein
VWRWMQCYLDSRFAEKSQLLFDEYRLNI